MVVDVPLHPVPGERPILVKDAPFTDRAVHQTACLIPLSQEIRPRTRHHIIGQTAGDNKGLGHCETTIGRLRKAIGQNDQQMGITILPPIAARPAAEQPDHARS